MKLTKNFSKSEFDSKDGLPMPFEVLQNVQELAVNLQVLRDYIGTSISINSGYRSPKHNKKIGGSVNSQHLLGNAADIVVTGKTPKEVKEIIENLISEKKMKQGGLSAYPTFVHYDIRGTKARW
jgi:uncharacterized protein YcbK (DUF882 family)